MVLNETIGTANIEIRADFDRLQKDMRQARRAAQQGARGIGGAFQRARNATAQFAKSVFTLKNAAITAAGAAGLGLLAKSAIRAADNIGKTANRVGVTAEALQELRFAAEQAGVEQRLLDDGLQRFNRRLGEAIRGNKSYIDSFKELGINLDDVESGQTSVREAFLQTADSVSKLETSTAKASLISKAFGEDAGPKLVNLLEQGRAGILNYSQQAQQLGIILGNDLIAKAEEAGSNLDLLGQIVQKNFQAGFISGFVDEFNSFSDLAKDSEIQDGIRAIATTVGSLARFLLDAAAGAAQLTQEMKDLVTTSDIERLNQLQQRRQEITENPRGSFLPNTPIGDAEQFFRMGELNNIDKEILEIQQRIARQRNVDQNDAEREQRKVTIETKRTGEAIQENNEIKRRGFPEFERSNAAVEEQARLTDFATDVTERLGSEIRSAGDSWDVFNQGISTSIDSFGDLRRVALNVIQDIANNLIKLQTGGLVSNSTGGFLAKGIDSFVGGIFGGSNAPTGGTPLPAPKPPLPLAATGGVFNQPFIGGEAGPEAAVPLPDGKRIPVDLKGGGSPNITVINNTPAEVSPSVSGNGRDFTVQLDQAVAQQIGTRGSQTRRSLEQFSREQQPVRR